jgi:glycerol transport system ATP-binding protein
VFQFPVIYDTMTVAENLAFPLRNRGVPADKIKQRVGKIAEMLEMSGQLDTRAAGLAADAKQKISLGRGLVREDVSAVLFDEPLTVIDPHLKWQLRRKLKQIHHELKLTLIYVTHDQVEALTFADQVVVMTRGRAVQVGSASDLFERPQHTFVGHFIGSPGMNFLPAALLPGAPAGAKTLGVRPPNTWPWPTRGRRRAAGHRAPGAGHRHLLAADRHPGRRQRAARAPAARTGRAPAGDSVWLGLLGRTPASTTMRGAGRMKPVNQKAWFLILPVVLCVAFSAILPLMTVVNYSVQDIISPERRSSSAPSGSRR